MGTGDDGRRALVLTHSRGYIAVCTLTLTSSHEDLTMATRTDAKQSAKPPAPPKFDAPPTRPDRDVPSIDHTVNTIGAHVLADAIDAYEHARHRHDVIDDRLGGEGPDSWGLLTQTMKTAAANNVALAILTWYYPGSAKVIPREALAKRWPALGVSYQGKVYSAVPDPDHGHFKVGDVGEGHCQVTHLSVVDVGVTRLADNDLAELTDLNAFFGWHTPPLE